MELRVEIMKRHMFVLVLAFAILCGVVLSYAYGGSNPPIFGHNAGEVEETDPTVLASVKDGVSWSEISGRPSGLDDGDDVGLTSETDPTVLASVKDGVSWSEVSGRPVLAGCPAGNINEGGKVYGRAMGFNDDGGGNDFYVCCRDQQVIYFGYGGRGDSGSKCDESGNKGASAVGI